MREDLRTAVQIDDVLKSVSEEQLEAIAEYVPANSKVLCSLGRGTFLLLDTGILLLESQLFKGGIKGAELVPFSHLGKVSVKYWKPIYTLEVHRNRANQGNIAGSGSPFTKLLGGTTVNRDNAYNFQELLLGLMAGTPGAAQSTDNSLEKIGQLKQLLDSGAITQDEFDEKKKKLMDSI
jgi:hypothetical protein